MLNTIGNVGVAATAGRTAGAPPTATMTATFRRTKFGRNRRQSIVLTVRPVEIDGDVLALEEANFFQAIAERGNEMAHGAAEPLHMNPITGIAGCCARAASGHLAAAPPSSVMNSRRHHSITSSARASTVAGRVTPIPSAVRLFMTSLKAVGCSIGSSPGGVPCRILSTYVASWR